MPVNFRVVIKWLYIIPISMSVAAVLCLILFFALNFLISPKNINGWISFYFEEHNGIYFIVSVIVVTVAILPVTRRMRLVR